MIKKHNWLKYGKAGEIVEITIKDFQGKELDFFRCNNHEDYDKVIYLIQRKYGYGASHTSETKLKDEVAEEKAFLEKTRQKNWLDKGTEW